MRLYTALPVHLLALPFVASLAVGCLDSSKTPELPAPVPSVPAPVPTPTPVPPPAVAKVCDAYTGPALSALTAYEGLMHEHSSYSDGEPTSIPADYFRIAQTAGYSFVGSSEHSDSLDIGNFLALHASLQPHRRQPGEVGLHADAGPRRQQRALSRDPRFRVDQ